MLNYLKAQLFALAFFSILLIVVIARTPIADFQVIELTQSLETADYKDIVQDSSFRITTSNDPYIILPTFEIMKLDTSFLHLNIDYSKKLCEAKKGEAASFIQVFWRTANQDFSEDKSDATPISLSRSDYLIPLKSLSKKSLNAGIAKALAFRLDTINKKGCRFKVNKIAFGIFKE